MLQERDRILLNARRVLENTFLFDNPWDMEATSIPQVLPEPIDWEYQPYDDPEWTFMLSRHGFILDLAHAYEFTDDMRYAAKACSLILSFIGSVPYGSHRGSNCWRSLDSAIRVDNWLAALPPLESSGMLDDGFLSQLRMSVQVHAEFLASVDTVFSKLSNWGLISNGGLYHAALWLGDARYEELAVRRIVECVGYQVLADGMHWEQSPMYHAECLRSLMQDVRLSRRYGHGLPDEIPEAARRMCHATLASMKPDGRQFLQSDSDDTSVRGLLSEGALLFRDPVLKFGGLAQLEPPFPPAEQAEYDSLEVMGPAYTSVALSESGNYYLRSGWGPDATVTHFRCGALGSGHGHADLLHVDLSGFGRDILVDSGRYTYVDTVERRTLKSGFAHNGIILDGMDSFAATDSWGYSKKAVAVQRQFVERGDWCYCCGGTLGYMEGGRPMFVQRHLLSLGSGLLVIFDTFHGADGHDCLRSFHFSPDGYLHLGTGCVRFDTGDVRALLWFDGKESARLAPSSYSPRYNILEKNVALELRSTVGHGASRCTVVQLMPCGGSSLDDDSLRGVRVGGSLDDADGRDSCCVKGERDRSDDVDGACTDSICATDGGTNCECMDTASVLISDLGRCSFSLVEEVPVVGATTGKVFSETDARAFTVHVAGRDDVTVLFCLEQCIKGVDLLRAGDILGYGSVIVRQGTRQEVFTV